uniref:Uncharacterized protein n=1 Tax=Periophthalmus magnuspinnatus TaxID=409849 RepID=A0A3B4B7K3_9GOBI
MAASLQGVARVLWRLKPSVLPPLRIYQPCLRSLCPRASLSLVVLPSHSLCQAVSLQDEGAAHAAEALSRYKEKPWEYLESEEYIEKYGSSPVWTGYRRNHKGGIPPQKTRKTCIRGDKICGNPCPICRDANIIIHPQNVKLLEQFISPYTGMVYDPTKTGKMHFKISLRFLPFQIPYVEFTKDNYSNSHDAVGTTPPPPSLTAGESWYKWYSQITPDETEVTKVKRKYKAYLK